MAISTKASLKSFFQAGDKPTEAQFIDLIDSYQDNSEALQALGSAAANGQRGLVRILSSATASVQAVGVVGIQLIDSSATGSALAALGGGTGGIAIFSAPTTAAVINQLGGGTVGNQLIGAVATASAVNALGTGLGIQFLADTTTASGSNHLGLGTISVQAASNVSITGGSLTGLITLNVANAAAAVSAMDSLSRERRIGAWISFAGDSTPSAKTSFNVSSITDAGTGSYRVNFTTVMSTVNFCATMNAQSSTATHFASQIFFASATATFVGLEVRSDAGSAFDADSVAVVVVHP